MQDLEGRNAILTGASRGLGVHMAEALAHEGMNLVLAARSADLLESVRGRVAALGVRAVGLPTDLAQPEQVAHLATEAERKLGPIDLLVNNAGVQFTQPHADCPPERIELVVRVNLLAPLLLAQAVLPGMRSRGRGHIVNIASLAGKIGLPFAAAYAATKAGLIQFTHSLRTELAGTPVGASVICPGFVSDDGMFARSEDLTGPAPVLLTPTTPDRVARAVLRSIRRNTAETIVNPLPARLLSVLQEAIPGSVPFTHRLLGTTEFAGRLAPDP